MKDIVEVEHKYLTEISYTESVKCRIIRAFHKFTNGNICLKIN